MKQHVSHSHKHHCEDDSEVSVSITHKNAYETHRSHDKGSALIGVVIWVSKQKQRKEIATVRQLMLMLCERKLKESVCSLTVNSIVSTTSTLILNELNQNKQWNSLTQAWRDNRNSLLWAQRNDGLIISQLYEGVKEPALKRRDNCQSEYRCSSCD
jgi:hypothetical protein